MKKRYLISVICIVAAIDVFAHWWFMPQRWLTGQSMERGPNQIALFELSTHGDDKNRRYNLYVLDVDTGQVVQLTKNHAIAYAEWSEDGSVLEVFTDSGRDYRIDPSTGEATLVVKDHPLMFTDAFYDDVVYWEGGDRFAFSVKREGDPDQEIYVYLDSSDNPRDYKLVDHPGDDEEPAWSPDGKQIAFVTQQRDDKYRVIESQTYIIDVDGQNLRQIGRTDGSEIAWQFFLPSGNVIFQWGDMSGCLVPVDGGQVDCEELGRYTFSPDKSHLVALVNEGSVPKDIKPDSDECCGPCCQRTLPLYDICILKIDGAEFKDRRCYLDQPLPLFEVLWRP